MPAPVRPVKIRLEASSEAKSDNSRPDPSSYDPAHHPLENEVKRVFLIIGFSLGAAAFSLMLPHPDPLFAVTGCCKARGSYWALWYKNKMKFTDCDELNQDIDGDNVFDESGQVWWDVVCESK